MCNDLFENIDRIFSAPKELYDTINTLIKIDSSGKSKNGKTGTSRPKTSEEIKNDAYDTNAKTPKKSSIDEDHDEKYFEEETKNRIKSINDKLACKLKWSVPKIKQCIKDKIEELNIEKDREKSAIESEAEDQKNRLPKFMMFRNKKIQEIEECKNKKIAELDEKYSLKEYYRSDELANSFIKDIVDRIISECELEAPDDAKESIRESLRGFSRTIPSFIMAYGLDDTKPTMSICKLEEYIPEDVFKEVTGISLARFKVLRDGGNVLDDMDNPIYKEDGSLIHFDGGIFNNIVIDEAIRRFIKLYHELSDYFEDDRGIDIFDYTPLQKTNQKFTPKKTVIEMVDMLEKNNPGCFDDPSKTFIDIYMKSGLFVTEIVKRLYRSKTIKEIFPDSKDRLKHIFEYQVYGIAPTEIIHRIAINYIFGSPRTNGISSDHFKILDYEKEKLYDCPDKITEAINKLYL
jgi:hypothetical protein